MSSRPIARRAAAVACALASLMMPCAARAQDPPTPSPVTDPSATAEPKQLTPAEQHAQKAAAFYSDGNYPAAIAEFEKALSYDPSAKILVRNLAVVNEKAGNVDDALKWLKQYGTLDLTPEEREKNERDLRRLEGAKRELDEKRERERQAAAAAAAQQPHDSGTPAPTPPNGRIDALTISAAAVGGAGLLWGTIWGIKASSDKPQSGLVTGKNGITYGSLSDQASKAHREAIMADVGFGLAIAGGVSAVLLYALRPKDAPAPATEPEKPTVSAIPLVGGGVVVVHGAW